MTCYANSPKCNGQNVQEYGVQGTKYRRIVLCDGCYVHAIQFGAFRPVDRRSEDRTAWKPVWLRNLQARDETGYLR